MSARIVNRLGSFGMGFLGVRLAGDLGADLGLVGWVLTVFGACTIPSRILGGLLANRFGARTALVIGLLSCAAAQILIALGTSVPVVIVGAVTLGLAYEIIEPATQAVVADAVPPRRRASSYSLLWAAMAVAGVAAGVLAAVLTRWGIATLFVADAATSLVAAAVVAFLLPHVRAQAPSSPWRAAASGRLLAWTVVGCVYATLMMVVVFMLPLAVEASGRPQSTTGWVLAVAAAAAILAQRLVARCEDRIAPAGLLALGYVVLALGLCLWAWGTLPGLVVGAAFEGASGSFLLGTQQAIASRMAPPGGAATVMTIYGLSWGVGTVGAPLFGTALLQIGTAPLWLTCSGVAAALAVGHGVPALRATVQGKEIGRFPAGGPIWAPHRASAASLVSQIRNGVRRQS